MKALLRAIRQTLTGDGIISGLCTGGVHSGRGPDDAAMPYLVVSTAGGFLPQYYTGSQQVEHITVRFQAWSTSAETAIDTVERIESIFRNANPALDSGTVICVTKGSDGLELDPDPTDTGHDVWMGILDLDFMVQRDPTA